MIYEAISYCFRPVNSSENLFRNNFFISDQHLTFEKLRLSNYTHDLLLWSSQIDLIEKYEYYLNEMDLSLSNELYFDCTKPWFCLRCEYSFELSEEMSIINIVENKFQFVHHQ